MPKFQFPQILYIIILKETKLQGHFLSSMTADREENLLVHTDITLAVTLQYKCLYTHYCFLGNIATKALPLGQFK